MWDTLKCSPAGSQRAAQSCDFSLCQGFRALCHWCSCCCLQAHPALKAGCFGKEAAASCGGEAGSEASRAGLVCKKGLPVAHRELGHSLGTPERVSPTWNPLFLSHVTTHDFLSWLHTELGSSWSVNFSKHYKIAHIELWAFLPQHRAAVHTRKNATASFLIFFFFSFSNLVWCIYLSPIFYYREQHTKSQDALPGIFILNSALFHCLAVEIPQLFPQIIHCKCCRQLGGKQDCCSIKFVSGFRNIPI